VVSVVERTRSLSTDPVALGIIGALTLGFIATGLFAVVGLTVSAAVSARQRRTEFALLRALGLSGRQLSASLWLENGSLVLVSLLAGTSLGLLIGWLVLPFVTVTQRATAPIPPVVVHVPWDRILLLDIASALALGVAVVVIGGVLRRLGVGATLRMGED
jgi:ABC-type antimicrobial peptide transport system permease subunit